MCGRYYVDDETLQEIRKLVKKIGEDLKNVHTGDIFPSQRAPVLLGRGGELSGELFPWGFPENQKNKVIFNARSESLFSRQMFRDCARFRRCVIPAAAFYEWNPAKEKYTFRREKGGTLYLAGIYDNYGGEERFVILTTEPNESVREIHDRMPLVLEQRQYEEWIFDGGSTERILRQKPEKLSSYTDYEQQELKFE